ncbi:MAG TPA: HAMP domain-containing sensor histidine kinase [Candidatus Acidoferrum sp.]|nr:HAMP domain-containing sensor histidine kinase [Candidatus Acidoferrum sp.]
MRITSRTRAIVFFIALGVCLVGLALFLNVSWIVVNWRRDVPLVLGIIFFGVIIAGVVVNTIFLVREIRRNEQQDSFLNAVTHELKTPIASIRLYLETLQSRGIDDAQRREFYRIMLEDADRLLATVEQVLKAGEARQGSRPEHWQEVDFAKIVEETAELARLRHNLPPQTMRFGAEARGELLVMGKPEELRTAVFNLFDNAIKYSGEQKDIVVDLASAERDTIVLSVRDRGIGIPRPELKRIFSRFYRVPNSGQVKGTGLGLFIVRAVARRYGGDAYAESEGEGRGSTFTISLPRAHRA